MRPAIFLDRDGVLNREKSYICKTYDLEIFPYIKKCIYDIHKLGYLAIVVSNQSAVARGLLEESELLRMNEYLISETGVDSVYYCPHHEKGIVSKYAVKCDCRKPKTGMILRAKKEFSIDTLGSYMVGDRASDILLGENAGLKTVLLNSGYGVKRLEMKVSPDFIFEDLRGFVEMLRGKSK